jgi:hypothetical protein
MQQGSWPVFEARCGGSYAWDNYVWVDWPIVKMSACTHREPLLYVGWSITRTVSQMLERIGQGVELWHARLLSNRYAGLIDLNQSLACWQSRYLACWY